jgi:hypothetical protein
VVQKKVRPSVLVCETADTYRDFVVCAISSVVPFAPSPNEILLQPTQTNNLRKPSVLKVDRIVTIKNKDVIAILEALDANDLVIFRAKFKDLL